MKLNDLLTPALILDKARLARNTMAMTKHARGLGVDLRPHLKTAKSSEVAKLALSGNAGGITVATMRDPSGDTARPETLGRARNSSRS